MVKNKHNEVLWHAGQSYGPEASAQEAADMESLSKFKSQLEKFTQKDSVKGFKAFEAQRHYLRFKNHRVPGSWKLTVYPGGAWLLYLPPWPYIPVGTL